MADEPNQAGSDGYSPHQNYDLDLETYQQLMGDLYPSDGSSGPAPNNNSNNAARQARETWWQAHPEVMPGETPAGVPSRAESDEYRRKWQELHPRTPAGEINPDVGTARQYRDWWKARSRQGYRPDQQIIPVPGTPGIDPDGRPWPPRISGPIDPRSIRDGVVPIPQPAVDQQNEKAESLNRMQEAIKSMLGHSINEYDRSVKPNLGCASFVSMVLKQTYGFPHHDVNVNKLEQDLQRSGFKAYPINQAQPGDVIVGHRQQGQPGHTAIYLGDGKMVHSSSSHQRIMIDDSVKFSSPDFKRVIVYRKM